MERLRELRKQHNLTTQQLADLIGCSNPTITNYERGNRKPDPDTLIKLAQIFNVTVDFLLGLCDKKDLIERPPYEVSDKQLNDFIKLFKVMNDLQKAQVLGYVIGLLEQSGINVASILN